MKKLLAFVLALSLLCMGGVALADGETLVIYSARNERLNNIVIPAFEAKTGIKVEMITGSSGEVLQRVKSEVETGNVTVYNFLYPILNSREVARNIVCSKDPGKALQEHMLNGTEPPAAKCDDSVLDRNLALGAKFEISGTPFIIFENGSRVTGALPSDQLNRGLNLK